MTGLLEHKGYYGTVEFSKSDSVFFGKIIGINSMISYEGESQNELRADFEESVDEYLKLCQENCIEPEKPFSGNINAQISPELHKRLIDFSIATGKSLNETIEYTIQKFLLA